MSTSLSVACGATQTEPLKPLACALNDTGPIFVNQTQSRSDTPQNRRRPADRVVLTIGRTCTCGTAVRNCPAAVQLSVYRKPITDSAMVSRHARISPSVEEQTLVSTSKRLQPVQRPYRCAGLSRSLRALSMSATNSERSLSYASPDALAMEITFSRLQLAACSLPRRISAAPITALAN